MPEEEQFCGHTTTNIKFFKELVQPN